MIRKLACAMFVLTITIGVVAAEEFTATITAVDAEKGTVTFQKFKKAEKKGEKGEKDGDPMTLVLAKDATIAKGNFKKGKIDAGDKLEDGLKNEVFTKIDEKKGVPARLTTEGEKDKEKITQLLVILPKKKKDAE